MKVKINEEEDKILPTKREKFNSMSLKRDEPLQSKGP
jgi:hypothetical protein